MVCCGFEVGCIGFDGKGVGLGVLDADFLSGGAVLGGRELKSIRFSVGGA